MPRRTRKSVGRQWVGARFQGKDVKGNMLIRASDEDRPTLVAPNMFVLDHTSTSDIDMQDVDSIVLQFEDASARILLPDATECIARSQWWDVLGAAMPLYDSRCRVNEETVVSGWMVFKVETGRCDSQSPLDFVWNHQVALASKRRLRPAKRDCTVAWSPVSRKACNCPRHRAVLRLLPNSYEVLSFASIRDAIVLLIY